MNLPLMVRCTNIDGEVVDVNLSMGFVWATSTIEGQRVTKIYTGQHLVYRSRTYSDLDDEAKAQVQEMQTYTPCQIVRQTPTEIRALIREARKAAIQEEMEIRQELEAESKELPA